MASRKNPPDSNGMKPLPKPVRPASLKSNEKQPEKKPIAVIDPDDFELPYRSSYSNAPAGRTPSSRPVRPYSKPTLKQAVVIFIRRMGKKIDNSLNKFKDPNPRRKKGIRPKRIFHARILGLSAAVILFVTIITLGIYSLTAKNAIAVYMDDKLIGYVARSKDLEEIDMHSQAVRHLETSLGAQVQVSQKVHSFPARSSRKDIHPYNDIISQISRGFTYKIVATAIFAKGQEYAVLKTRAEAESVAKELQSAYFIEGITIESSFLEDFEYITVLADLENLNTIDEAVSALDKSERTMEDYIVQRGDMLGTIAQRFNMSTNKLADDNFITLDTIIRPGEILKIETVKPYLSVRTVDEIIRTETVEPATETRENPLQPHTYFHVINEGKNGLREITVRVIKINGVQTGQEEVIRSITTVEPIKRIVEVGTADASSDRR